MEDAANRRGSTVLRRIEYGIDDACDRRPRTAPRLPTRRDRRLRSDAEQPGQRGEPRPAFEVESDVRDFEARRREAQSVEGDHAGRNRREDRDRLPGRESPLGEDVGQHRAGEPFEHQAGAPAEDGGEVEETGQRSQPAVLSGISAFRCGAQCRDFGDRLRPVGHPEGAKHDRCCIRLIALRDREVGVRDGAGAQSPKQSVACEARRCGRGGIGDSGGLTAVGAASGSGRHADTVPSTGLHLAHRSFRRWITLQRTRWWRMTHGPIALSGAGIL
ncbi:hypothetical protein [Agromyces seonyuensis]|nr:hypothetical protein [Agromyces seonyuensis]